MKRKKRTHTYHANEGAWNYYGSGGGNLPKETRYQKVFSSAKFTYILFYYFDLHDAAFYGVVMESTLV